MYSFIQVRNSAQFSRIYLKNERSHGKKHASIWSVIKQQIRFKKIY